MPLTQLDFLHKWASKRQKLIDEGPHVFCYFWGNTVVAFSGFFVSTTQPMSPPAFISSFP